MDVALDDEAPFWRTSKKEGSTHRNFFSLFFYVRACVLLLLLFMCQVLEEKYKPLFSSLLFFLYGFNGLYTKPMSQFDSFFLSPSS